MAWYEGTISSGAGNLLSVFDNYLTLNSKWSIYDGQAGTNKKVYRNYSPDDYSDFYLEVDNNYSTYALIKLWQGWDAENHVGVGYSTSPYHRINYGTQAWHLSVLDLNFVLAFPSNGNAYYIGQLDRYDKTKNMPLLMGLDAGYSGSAYNVLGFLATYSGTLGFRLLFNHNGDPNIQTSVLGLNYNSTLYFKDTLGRVILEPLRIYELNTNKSVGRYERVVPVGYANNEFSNGDVIWEGGNEWRVYKANYGTCLVKKI